MAPPLGARCAKHVDAAAVDLCQRCGTFLCGECVQIRAEDVFCADCSRLLDRPPSGRSKVAFALATVPWPLVYVLTYGAGPMGAIAGLAGIFPLCASSLALILQERSARRRGESTSRGAFYPLTWGMLALNLLALVGLVLFVVRDLASAVQ